MASLYAVVEDGQVDTAALPVLVAEQWPRAGIGLFPLDSSCWPRPRGRVLADWQYVYQACSDVNGGTVTIGYPYSLLEGCTQPHASWSLPLHIQRISSQTTAQEVGAHQVQERARLLADCLDALDIVPADGKYGNAAFLRRVQGLRVGVVARLRRDRVLYRPAPSVSKPRRGRPRQHGCRFAFQDPTT